jgi:hypothetical protein
VLDFMPETFVPFGTGRRVGTPRQIFRTNGLAWHRYFCALVRNRCRCHLAGIDSIDDIAGKRQRAVDWLTLMATSFPGGTQFGAHTPNVPSRNCRVGSSVTPTRNPRRILPRGRCSESFQKPKKPQ